ncbi:TrbI/VirB10 family protein [Brevundimonas sp.]|uniref:TrbI/VirB10 family protein n=1 Tax=Brevundimonas sp. TaxID=1871086 RepID=UPI00257C7EB5|nr:TrbI/VirB10 family protein [Brevundimonas sp.]
MTDHPDTEAPHTGPEPRPVEPAPSARKAPAPPLMGRAPRPGAVRIRKPVVQAMVGGAALLLSGSLAWAFIVQPDLKAKARDAAEAERLDEARGGVRPSDRVTDQPSTYDRLEPGGDQLPPPRGAEEAADRPVDPSVAAPARVPNAAYGPPRAVGPRPPGVAQQAAASGLFFDAGRASGASAPAGDASAGAAQDPTLRDYGAIYSPHGLVAPVSPYELKAGAIVPGVLLTGVDTARPGPVVATVTQNVFDSITGRHLLVPQGARLIGRHEGESAHGDRRAFLVWDRLILPNGKSVLLTEEPGVDGAGAVGVQGRTDRRLWSLGIASLFAGAITTLGELARGGGDDRSVIASAGDAASIEAAQVGGRLIDRELTVRPSIRVRAGAPVRVMITRDLILEPYRR